MLGFYPGSILPGKISLPEDKAAADKKAAEEKMEIERGVRLLDTSTGCGFSSGSFELPNDERQQLVQNFHCIHDKTNVSMSVNPKDLVCLTCPEKHAFIKHGPSPLPVCVALVLTPLHHH